MGNTMIEIVSAGRTYDDRLDRWHWVCWLVLNDTYALPATAPGELEEAELQAHFEAQEDRLWQIAQQKQHEPDVTLHLRERVLLRRLVKLMMDEINILREVAHLPPRTLEQLKRALKQL